MWAAKATMLWISKQVLAGTQEQNDQTVIIQKTKQFIIP